MTFMPDPGNNPSPGSPFEEDINELYEEAPCGYLSTLPDGTIIKVNTTFLEWTGYSRDTLLGKKRFQELLPVAGRVFYDTHFGPLLIMQGFVKELAFELLCEGGKRIPILLNSKLKRDSAGAPRLIRTTLLDARGRRTYEEELRLAKKKAEDAELAFKRLNEILEIRIAERTLERDRIWRTSQDILAVASVQGYFLSCNPAFTSIMGWTEEDMQAMPFTSLAHPEQSIELAQIMERLADGQPISRYDMRSRHKDGTYRWLSWTATPEGQLLYLVGRDVTNERIQIEALRQTEEALRQAQKMEAIGQLTGGIAHDFNNLLAGIMGNLDLMRLRISLNQTAHLGQHLDAAMSSTRRAAALTHRLLAFARRQTLVPKPVDVTLLVQSMQELIRRTVGPNIAVEAHVEPALWWTLCDQHQLENALLNLSINARDAMPDGGKITIRTKNMPAREAEAVLGSHVQAGDYVLLSVTDTGTGMTPEVIEHAFEPFFTTKPFGEGTGLGLSMVHGFMKQSDGYVTIDSRIGMGTTIKLYLPRHATGEAAAPDILAEAIPRATDKQLTVLVVDDEPALRDLLTDMLEHLGYAPLAASNAQEGMAAIESTPQIDLLVTDIGLPGGMNGRQLANAARQFRPDLKVLFITGYAEQSVIGKEALPPNMEVLVKPFAMDAFFNTVNRMTGDLHK
ncbi:hybrid sensor histidine kinase/response regulator [Noviherbaspirillum sp.]|uniref:hybrid sensor histidine kinase/response regulator n=1 Tax=Noviherbaspirillum sp. TaxID=1926288 RepID=UPI002FE38C35